MIELKSKKKVSIIIKELNNIMQKMHSSQIKHIKLKHKKSREIRKGLREIFNLAYNDEIDRLHKILKLYQDKRIHFNRSLTLSQTKRVRELHKIYENLYHTYRKSILSCSSGAFCVSYREMKEKGFIVPPNKPIDLDMVWVPHNQKWFCTKCFDKYLTIKTCENCRETNENTAKISECFFCSRYVCDLCKNICPDCGESYCNQCYFEHFNNNVCCWDASNFK